MLTLLNIINKLIVLTLILFVALSVWSNLSNLTLRNAVRGFTPLNYVYQVTDPDNFSNNFGNGIIALRSSLILRLYEVAHEIGIQPEQFQRVVIVLSVMLFAAVLWYFAKTVFPSGPKEVYLLTVMFGLASDVLNHNLARYGSFAGLDVGQMYGPVAVLSVFSFICAFRKSWILCFISIGLSFCCHAVVGMIASLICCAILASEPSQLKLMKTWLGGLVGFLIAGAWYTFVIHSSLSSFEVIDAETWIAWARFGNFHWFPFSLNVFGSEHARRITPLLAIFILALCRLMSSQLPSKFTRMWYAAVLCILILSVIGLLASHYPFSVTLIKLGLHRSTMFLLLFSLPLALHLIVTDLKSEKTMNVFLAIVLLFTPITESAFGFPLLFAVIRFGLELKQRQNKRLIPVYSGSIIILLTVMFVSFNHRIALTHSAVASTPTVLAISALFAVTYLVIRQMSIAILARHITVLATICCLIFSMETLANSAHPERARDMAYLDVQLWAKENTPPGTLFMTEPSRAYGWRDYSQRPSFGSAREWIHTTWLYTGNKENFDEGMRRARLFGVEPDDYLKRFLESEKRSLGPEYRALLRDISYRYNSMDYHELADLAGQEGIDYFVFEKAVQNNMLYPVAYENEFYAVINSALLSQYEKTIILSEMFPIALPNQPIHSEKLKGHIAESFGWVNIGWRGEILVSGVENDPGVMRLVAGVTGEEYDGRRGHVLLLRPVAAHEKGRPFDPQAQFVQFECDLRAVNPAPSGKAKLRLDAMTPNGWKRGVAEKWAHFGGEFKNQKVTTRLKDEYTAIAPIIEWRPGSEGDMIELRMPKIFEIKFQFK